MSVGDDILHGSLPEVSRSTDSGNTWSAVSDFALPSGSVEAFLEAVTCTGNTCVTVGFSLSSGNKRIPLAYASTDAGNTWTPSSIPTLSGGQQGDMEGVTCFDSNNCIMVGYATPNGGGNALPLLMTSSDGGNNWTNYANLTLLSNEASGFLSGVTCNVAKNNCVAVGVVTNTNTGLQISLAYSSTDGGKDWTHANTFPAPSLSQVELPTGVTGE